jgi:hypothetical protein
MKTGSLQDSLTQQVPIKGLQVSDVENDSVPLRDRPLIKKLGLHVIK